MFLKPFCIIAIGVLCAQLLFTTLILSPTSGGDFEFYNDIALSLLTGDGFGNILSVAPGWPAYIAGIYTVFGESFKVLVSAQMLLAIFFAFSAYLFAYNILKLPYRYAVGVGIITGIWPMVLIQSFVLQSLLLYSVLFSYGMYAFFRTWDDTKLLYAVVAGLLFGASTLTDVIGLYIPLALLLAMLTLLFLRNRMSNPVSFKRFALAIVMIGIFVLSLMPWAHRNQQVFVLTDDVPIVVKFGMEKAAMYPEIRNELLKPFTPNGFSKLTKGIYLTIFHPNELFRLDKYTEFRYKNFVFHILKDSSVSDLSTKQIKILALKLLFTSMHLTLLFFAILGFFVSKSLLHIRLTLVYALGYVVVAVIAFGSMTDFSIISPPSGFFLPFLPFVVSFAFVGMMWLYEKYTGKFVLNATHMR